MKKRKIISAVALTMAIGMGATAYASADSTTSEVSGQRLGLGRITSMRGYDYVSNILENKLGLSDKEVSDAIDSGKRPYDLAVENGITEDEFKGALVEEKSKSIDDAVAKGIITKEEGENLKANLNTNIQNCTGNFGQRQGQGRGIMGNSQRGGCFVTPSN